MKKPFLKQFQKYEHLYANVMIIIIIFTLFVLILRRISFHWSPNLLRLSPAERERHTHTERERGREGEKKKERDRERERERERDRDRDTWHLYPHCTGCFLFGRWAECWNDDDDEFCYGPASLDQEREVGFQQGETFFYLTFDLMDGA